MQFPMSRPRYAWCSEVVEGTMGGIEVFQRLYCKELKAPAEYPRTEAWIEPGRDGFRFPPYQYK